MGKVALIHPQSYNPSKSALIWPPLGLCRIASYLEKRGHEVKIVEDALNKYEIGEIVEQVGDFELVGIGAMTLQASRASEIAHELRGYRKEVIAGGPHFVSSRSAWPFNAVVSGDGEQPMVKILENGVNQAIYHGEPVPYEPIDFKWIDYEKYGDHLIDGTRAISILTSRGCPFDCKFCGSPKMFGRKVTYYPVEEVVNNMIILAGHYNIKAFRIMDDSFTVNQKWVREFCEAIKPHGFRMSCLTHVNTIDGELLGWMKEAGFEFVAVGVESANADVLRICNKNITKHQIITAVATIKNVGMKVEALFMLGLPGETSTSLYESAELAIELDADRTHFQYFTPFPGCEFYNDIEKYGHIIDRDFNNYHHRKPTFLPHTISYNDLVEGAEMCMGVASV